MRRAVQRRKPRDAGFPLAYSMRKIPKYMPRRITKEPKDL
jgi:hypothetical protein